MHEGKVRPRSQTTQTIVFATCLSTSKQNKFGNEERGQIDSHSHHVTHIRIHTAIT